VAEQAGDDPDEIDRGGLDTGVGDGGGRGESHQLDRVGGVVEIGFGVDDLGATHDDGRSSGNGHSRRVGASVLLEEVSCLSPPTS
jgi:hypothetical protein